MMVGGQHRAARRELTPHPYARQFAPQARTNGMAQQGNNPRVIDAAPIHDLKQNPNKPVTYFYRDQQKQYKPDNYTQKAANNT